MYKAARHTLAQRAARRALLLLTLVAAITATLLLLSACTAQQLEPDPTAPIDPATLPADGRLAIARLDIATGGAAPQADIAQGGAAPATRIYTGAATWEVDDAIRVTATAKATGAPIVGYYAYQSNGMWLQYEMPEDPDQDLEVKPADTYPLYIDDIDRTQPIRIDCWGGNICDLNLHYPDDHIYTNQGTDFNGYNYHPNDYLAAPAATLHTTPGDTPGDPTRGSLTATLTHQRVDVVVRLITDAAHPLQLDAKGKPIPDFTQLHLALADGNSTGDDDATIRSWIEGSSPLNPPLRGVPEGQGMYGGTGDVPAQSVAIFRAYVEPADLPAAGADGITPLGTLTYATRVYNGDDGTGTITLPGSGKLPLKYKLSDPSTPVQAGTRLTITIDFTKLNGLALSATVSPWTIEEGGEIIAQPGADGTQPLDLAVFNASNPVWVVSGGGTPDTDALVAKNVKTALAALPPGTSNITLMMAEVKSVPKDAFRNCTQLAALTLSGATSIGAQAFDGCKALARIDLPEAQSIGAQAFDGCIALTAISLPAAQSIGAKAFASCITLTRIDLPAAQSFGTEAFYGCKVLTTVNLPAATSIDADIFADSKANIVTLDLSGLTAIGDGAFQGYTKLQSITLNGAKSVGKNAFDGCESLATALLPAATSIGQYAFIRTYLSTISLPAATSIGAQAFSGCTGLTTVSLPVAITVGDGAFSGCTALTSLSLPVAITVGDGAFAGCTALTTLSLTAPGSITVNAGSFGGFYSAACTLTLNADKAKDAAGDAKPKVEGKTWGGVAWQSIATSSR